MATTHEATECSQCQANAEWTVDGEVACLPHAVQVAADHFAIDLVGADLPTLVNLRDVLDAARAKVEATIKARVTRRPEPADLCVDCGREPATRARNGDHHGDAVRCDTCHSSRGVEAAELVAGI